MDLKKEHLSVIDFFKGLAIFAVAISHSTSRVTSLEPIIPSITSIGGRGVILLFILSGWTSYLSYHSKGLSKRIFYKKRFWSIAPGWYLMLILWQFILVVFFR